jgi:hypothetical protein
LGGRRPSRAGRPGPCVAPREGKFWVLGALGCAQEAPIGLAWQLRCPPTSQPRSSLQFQNHAAMRGLFFCGAGVWCWWVVCAAGEKILARMGRRRLRNRGN